MDRKGTGYENVEWVPPFMKTFLRVGRMKKNEIPYSFLSSVMHVSRKNTLSRYVIHAGR